MGGMLSQWVREILDGWGRPLGSVIRDGLGAMRAGAIGFKRIMVAYDGSTGGEKAFERGLRLSEGAGCSLAIVAAVASREYALDYGEQRAFEGARAALGAQVERLERRARFAGLQSTAIIGRGRLAQEVVRAADVWGADLIVIGERARDPFARWFGLSMEQYLVTHARCPVLVVR